MLIVPAPYGALFLLFMYNFQKTERDLKYGMEL